MHRPSEDYEDLGQIDMGKWSDEEEDDDDEDDFYSKKKPTLEAAKAFSKKPRRNSINKTESQSEIDEFLKKHNLQELRLFVETLSLQNMQQLRAFKPEEIKQYLGPQQADACKKLIGALDQLTLEEKEAESKHLESEEEAQED